MIKLFKFIVMQKLNFTFGILFTCLLIGMGCTATGSKHNNTMTMMIQDSLPQGKAAATFGAGCFWCVEAVFQQLDGVDTVISGYCGGNVPNPTYREVCYGKTGHAEVCRIVYDTAKISYRDLLQALFMSHDPTQLNRQGNDIGTQYRSVIFYHNDAQKAEAEKVIAELTAAKVFSSPIVTTLEPLQTFYKAEDYHQNYYNLNGEEPYCSFVIKPKVEKFKKVFQHQLKQKP